MNNVTYYFGAGASAEVLPVVNQISDRIKEQIKYINNSENFNWKDTNITNNIRDNKEKYIEDLNWLDSQISRHASIDTYAKKLYLTKDESNLFKLKIVFSIFMILEQLKKYADKRYDSFFASILEQSTIRFPKNVRIVSWNYDFQFEKAYSEYCSKEDICDIKQSLFIKNKFFESNADFAYDGFSISKLNGTTSLYNTQNYQNYDLFLSVNEWKNQFVRILDAYYPISISEYSREKLSSGLSFAWEHVKSRTGHTIVDIVKQDTTETNILVVVGYSFPYFNREVDREIIGNMNNLQKVYFQDLYPDSIRERFMSIRNDIPIENLFLRKDIKQFLFPNEL